MQQNGPTSRDVAQRAQVSQATVSAVLNRSRYVSPALVERVHAAIADLGYQPNAAARTLRTGRSGVIGLLVPNILSPYWSAFVRAVSHLAAERGLSLILTESEEDDATECARLGMLLERQLDGILLVTRGSANHDVILQISRGPTPLVLVHSPDDGLPLDSVRIDDQAGAYQATRHLLEHGCRRIGMINLPEARFGARSRFQGYQRALVDAGMAVDPTLVRHAGFFELDGYTAAQELLALPAPPDALLVSNHLMTIGALHAATTAGLAIPGDLALIGFDDTPWAAWTMPPLSLVDDPRDELAARALKTLLRRLQQPRARPLRASLPTRLILRRSCGCTYVSGQQVRDTAVSATRASGGCAEATPVGDRVRSA